MPRFLLALVLLMPLAAARPVLAASSCEATRVATAPVTVVGGRMLLDVMVDGRPATFQLDTGASLSLVTPEAVRRLDLPRDRWIASTVGGIGGIERRSVADADTIVLRGVELRQREPRQGAILAVATLAAPRAGGRVIDGLLGRDLLGAFDVELDLAGATLTLWHMGDCAGRFLPWTGPYNAIGALPAYGEALVIPVRANGVPLRALPDTGATETLLTVSGMVRLGLAPGGPEGVASGVGGRSRPIFPLRLSTLEVGKETRHDVPVLGSALRVHPIVDMLLGSDWFAAHRVWLSYATRQVFVSASP